MPGATSRTAAASSAPWRARSPTREHSEACLRLAAIARDAPLEAGAALLAVAAPRRGTQGERLIESARRTLSEDPIRLAAALGSNIPAPAQRSKQARKTKRKAEKAAETVSFNGAVVGSTPPATPVKRVDGVVEVEVTPRPSRCACATTRTRCSPRRSGPSFAGGSRATASAPSRPPSRCAPRRPRSRRWPSPSPSS